MKSDLCTCKTTDTQAKALRVRHLVKGEEGVPLHIEELAFVRRRDMRWRLGHMLAGIEAQQLVQPRLHLVTRPIPNTTQ